MLSSSAEPGKVESQVRTHISNGGRGPWKSGEREEVKGNEIRVMTSFNTTGR